MSAVKEHDTSWYLWELRFACQVPQLATMSETYLRMFGLPTSGNPDVDRTLNNQWLDLWLNIDSMVEYHRKGAPVRVLKHEDTLTIYLHIQDHLEAWAKHTKGGFHMYRVPKEDLIALDRLASHVYPHARNHFKDNSVQSSFLRSLESSAVLIEAPRPEMGEPEKAGERQDFTEMFASVPEGGFRWK